MKCQCIRLDYHASNTILIIHMITSHLVIVSMPACLYLFLVSQSYKRYGSVWAVILPKGRVSEWVSEWVCVCVIKNYIIFEQTRVKECRKRRLRVRISQCCNDKLQELVDCGVGAWFDMLSSSLRKQIKFRIWILNTNFYNTSIVEELASIAVWTKPHFCAFNVLVTFKIYFYIIKHSVYFCCCCCFWFWCWCCHCLVGFKFGLLSLTSFSHFYKLKGKG